MTEIIVVQGIPLSQETFEAAVKEWKERSPDWTMPIYNYRPEQPSILGKHMAMIEAILHAAEYAVDHRIHDDIIGFPADQLTEAVEALRKAERELWGKK